jgi:hypothetical protein
VLVLLATQVALADGMCHAVMLGGGHAMDVGATPDGRDSVVSPCSDDADRGVACRAMLIDAVAITTPPLAKPSVRMAVAPPLVYVPASSICAEHAAPRAPPDAGAATPLPAYLRFGRFLS